MRTLLRVAALLVIAVLLVEAVIAIGSGTTGIAEKIVVLALGAVLVLFALPRARRI